MPRSNMDVDSSRSALTEETSKESKESKKNKNKETNTKPSETKPEPKKETKTESKTHTNKETKTEQKREPKTETKLPQSNQNPLTSESTPSHQFTESDFSFLNRDEYFRFMPNSKKVGHAVLKKRDNQIIAEQYAIPHLSDSNNNPTVRPLVNIEAIERYGKRHYRARTPVGNTVMYSKRDPITGTIDDGNQEQEIEIACFSPGPADGKEPFWGSNAKTPLFRDDLPDAHHKELQKELQSIKPTFKGGQEVAVDPDSVRQRDQIAIRIPDQNTVMQRSACQAYQHFLEEWEDELHEEMKHRLTRTSKANLRGPLMENNYRGEWLHAEGFGLTHIENNPQVPGNLGAGPKWANTQMMILERKIKWFAIHYPGVFLSIKPKFEMLLDSELIKHIHFEVKIQIKERFVRLMQSIDPFLKYPLFPKASDLAQGTAIVYNLLHDVKPSNHQEVGLENAVQQLQINPMPASSRKRLKRNPSMDENLHKDTDTELKAKRPANDFKKGTELKQGVDLMPRKEITNNFGLTEQQYAALLQTLKTDLKKRKHHVIASDDSDNETDAGFTAKRATTNDNQCPTEQKYGKSIVEIYTEMFSHDYDSPWEAPKRFSCRGTGFVIGYEGKKYVMTNAHVVADNNFIHVRLTNNRQKQFKAKCLQVSYQCDLALLTVDDPEFQAMVEPVEFGEMVNRRTKVLAVGFPIGGTEISMTKGIVSRIQVGNYSMCQEDMLLVQVDASLNPGNSGGPVFCNDKVIGVAFQVNFGGAGLNYIIPTPIISHFLKEVFSGMPYRGFPILPIEIEDLENVWERRFYQLGERTGVRIKSIDFLSDAHAKLQADDILLSIDGMPISNEGTIQYPGIFENPISFIHATHTKYIGDTVMLEVLRKNKRTQKSEVLNIEVLLDCVPGDTKKVGSIEHDKRPTYYINSGICFVPFTLNYLNGDKGAELADVRYAESDCDLEDVPKRKANDQIIIVNDIFNYEEETRGYEKRINGRVKEINGVVIQNMEDVISAMENNPNDLHEVTLVDNSKTVLPQFSRKQMKHLLKQYHIHADRSEDLMKPDDNRIYKSKHEHESHESEREGLPPITATANLSENKLVSKTNNHHEAAAAMSNMTPGMQRTLGMFAAMCERIEQGNGEEENDESDDATYDENTLSHSSDNDYESENESEEEKQPAKVQVQAPSRRNAMHHVSMFKPVQEKIRNSENHTLNLQSQTKHRL